MFNFWAERSTVMTVRRWARCGSAVDVLRRALLGAALLLPGGFLLGGLFPYGGDPGLGIFLVPPAAVLLFVGVGTTARALLARG